jgi:GH15 family glucan-1,4-alpha-glucosidase
MDAGMWQYNAEWVGDACAAAVGAVHAGNFDVAKAILVRVMKTMVREDGSPAEASRFVTDDMVEMNQSGQLLLALWTYGAWTGDDLLGSNWSTVEKIVEFLLRPAVLDKSGLLHNRRDFWERTEMLGIKDGFELSHQACVIAGLGRILEYAKANDHKENVTKWEPVWKKMGDTMLLDPKFAMVADGRFVKRKSMTGEVVSAIVPADRTALQKGSPLAAEDLNSIDPDATLVLPIIYGLVPPAGDIAQKTLVHVEKLWNQRWQSGGYARYDVSSEPDSPGAWPFASIFIARANALAGNSSKVQQVLDWLVAAQGGQGGGWFENYGDRVVPPLPPVGFVPYAWGEMLTLFVRELLGFRPDEKQMVVRPKLLAGITSFKGRVRYREGYIDVSIAQGAPAAVLNGKPLTVQAGEVVLPAKLEERSTLEITLS